jgi:hypothetical protein
MSIVIPQSANGWTTGYLEYFGIEVSTQGTKFKDFFGIPKPRDYGVGLSEASRSYVSNNVAKCLEIGPLMIGDRNRIASIKRVTEDAGMHAVHRFYTNLEILYNRYPNVKRCTDSMIINTLDMLGFNRIDPRLRIMPSTTFVLPISNTRKLAIPDVLAEYTSPRGSRIVLLIHETKDMSMGEGRLHHALPQLVAEAIAVFRSNNPIGSHVREETIYGVTVLGTASTFYKIPVTVELATLVESGESAEAFATSRNRDTSTMCEITWCSPVVFYHAHGIAASIAYSTHIFRRYLRSYEALRRLVASRLAEISRDDPIPSDEYDSYNVDTGDSSDTSDDDM